MTPMTKYLLASTALLLMMFFAISIISDKQILNDEPKKNTTNHVLPLLLWDSKGLTPQYLPFNKKIPENERLFKRDLSSTPSVLESNHEKILDEQHGSMSSPPSNFSLKQNKGHLTQNLTTMDSMLTMEPSSVNDPATSTNTVNRPSELPSAEKYRELRPPVHFPTRSLTIHSTTPTSKFSAASRLSGLCVLSFLMYRVMLVQPNIVPSITLLTLSILGDSMATYLTVFDSAGRFTKEELDTQTVSLLGVDDCSSVASSYKSPMDKNVQVLFQAAESALDVLQCHIKVTTKIYPCYSDIFRSDTYPAILLQPPHIKTITDKECRDLYKSKRFTFEILGHIAIIEDFTRHEQTKSIILSGERLANGGCTGSAITVDNIRHKNAILETEITYFTKKMKGKYLPSTNLVYVSNLITYPIDQPSCDAALGCFFIEEPDMVPKDSCEMTQQIMLGTGKLFVPNTQSDSTQSLGYVEIMQILSKKDHTQGVTVTLESTKFLCGKRVRLTNIPHVYINVLQDNPLDLIEHRLITKSNIEMREQQYLDLLSSSSSLYLAGTLDMATQFDQISHRICSLRRSALLGLLRDMLISSPHVLLNYFEGLLFLRRASTITIYVGNPLPAQLRMTTACYDEIPVLINVNGTETPMFATSKGRILVDNATQVPCSPGPMHYLMSESDEKLKLNRTIKNAFIALAFGEFRNQLTRGGWLCQGPETFVSCTGPTRLSPLITEDENFFHGLGNNFIHKNLFGDERREDLFKSQSVGYERETLLAKITDSARGGHMGLMRTVIQNMPLDVQQQLREKLMPTIYLIIGGLTNYIEEFLIITFAISVVINFIKMLIRIRIIYYKHGWSRYLLSAFFEGAWGIFMPWHSAKFHRQELELLVSEKANQLGNIQQNETMKTERMDQRICELESYRALDFKKLAELTLEISNIRETIHRPPIFDRLRDIAPLNATAPPKYDQRASNEDEDADYTPLIK